MTREIKFRAWDGEQMVSPDYIDRNGVAYWKENSIPTKSDKVMQYVGKIGYNKCELFEGDIVKATFNHHGKRTEISFNAFIAYNEHVGTFQIKYKNINDHFVSDEIGFRYFLDKIGNIHQNPELL